MSRALTLLLVVLVFGGMLVGLYTDPPWTDFDPSHPEQNR